MYYEAHQQPSTHLMTAQTLSDLISSNAPHLIVLDVGIPMPGEKRDCHAEFKEKHIKGARFLSLRECQEKETDNAYMLPSLETFTANVQAKGVVAQSKVVVYDANMKKGMFSSPRAWYMFRVFGHREIYVLDGGLQNWIAQGYETESGDETPAEPSEYRGGTYHPDLVKSLEDIRANIKDKKFELVDARSQARFDGLAPEPRPDIKSGHIPNAKCMFWTQFLDEGFYKSADKLADIYKAAGVDPKAPHVATCGSGISACFIALSSYILGNYSVPVYDGSWMDWYQHAPPELKESVPQN